MTFGEKAVGLSFNPSGDDAVHKLKCLYAQIIDIANDARGNAEATAEQKRLYSVAITEAQGAQMWAVKAATWRD
jgi:polyferredoxin